MSDLVPIPVPGNADGAAPDANLARLFVLSAGRETPTDARELLADQLRELPAAVAAGLDEWLVLHTCHRVELAGVTAVGMMPPSIPGMVVTRGSDAVERLLAVGAGLESAVLAEEQLLGQIRDAYAAALAQGHTGPVLNELTRRAIRLGKRSRAMATPGADRSLAARALAWALEPGADLPALLLGTGIVARELAAGLAGAGLQVRIASADPERAASLAAAIPGAGHRAVSAAGATAGGPWSVVAAATRVRHPILQVDDEPSLRGARVIDLCAPPAVAPDLAGRLGDSLMDLDRLGRMGAVAGSPLSDAALRRLRIALREEKAAFEGWLAGRSGTDAIAMLRQHAEALRERHLDRLRRRGIVDPHQLAAVEHMAHAMLAELLHVPTTELRKGGDGADRVRALFGIPR